MMGVVVGPTFLTYECNVASARGVGSVERDSCGARANPGASMLTPLNLATTAGRTDEAELLRQHGGHE
jgi:hypothetical protein